MSNITIDPMNPGSPQSSGSSNPIQQGTGLGTGVAPLTPVVAGQSMIIDPMNPGAPIGMNPGDPIVTLAPPAPAGSTTLFLADGQTLLILAASPPTEIVFTGSFGTSITS